MINTGDAELATESFGNSADPAILLVMGATASMLWWPEEFCEGLAARGHHVIRFDHRDTGRSTTNPPGEVTYAAEDIAADLIAILDAYSIDRADFIGMSLGGYVSQMAALTHPDRVRTLTLIGSEPLGWTGPELPGISPVFMAHFGSLEQLDWSDTGAVANWLLGTARLCAGSAHPFDAEREMRRIAREIARARNIRSAFNHGAISLREDWSGGASRIARPTLVVHGTEDPILPLANGEALAATIPGARLVTLRGIGHELPAPVLPRLISEIAAFVDAAG